MVVADISRKSDGGQPVTLPLWPEGVPNALGAEAADTPTVTFYRPERAKATGAAMVICPGGGYTHLAPHEGEPVAKWLMKLGITGVVLKYRLGPRYRHPVPLADAARAMRVVRARAAEWYLDPSRIGILGFSAGGHLASTVCTHFGDGDKKASDAIERVSSRPDVAVLLYPVISMMEGIGHGGSRQALLGEKPAPELMEFLSSDQQVTRRTPPTFLFHTVEDGAVPVENSLMYALSLRRNKVSFEMHLYEHGPHGVGLAEGDAILSTWPARCAAWLAGKGFAGRQ